MTPKGEDLIARCRVGDQRAFAELFLRHRAEVARLVFRMMGPRVDVDDIVQDVFLHVHRSLRDFRGDARLSTWLHRITVNVVLMARRAARSRPVLTSDESGEGPAYDGMLPDEEVVRRERLAAFRRCVDKLSEKKRTVFLLHDVEGMSAAEIGATVSAPALTVRTRLFYARRELASSMRSEPALAALALRFERGEPERAALAHRVLGEETSS